MITQSLRVGGLAVIVMFAAAPMTRAGQVQVNGKTFTLPDGFELELAASSPVAQRPIVADFDELGRLYVAESSGSSDNVQKQLKDRPHRIVRLEDGDGDGKYDKRVVFADQMMFPEGAMWHDGSLYVSAPPSIWKLTDTDGDGVADQRVEWFGGKTLTGCANDLHGPYLGPDGMIYWCKGAFAKQTYERSGKKPFVTRAAHIFRARPDGGGIEPVMTGGMDNPVEVVFTPDGERIFTTTFFQHPGGGKRDGLVHAVYGGVYGKVHDVIDDPSQVRTSPEVLPVLSHLGPAAPAGLYRYESEVFGPEYTDNLFTASFNLHKVFRHELKPEGATFVSKDSDFLVCDSLDFHPTDVLEDADGGLLVVDTGGWYKLCCPTSQLHKPDILGAIYRVRRTGAAKVEDPRGLKLDWEKMSAEQVAGLLGDARPAVRKRAMAALAKRDRGESAVAVANVIKGTGSNMAKLNAVWTATRIDHPDARAAVRQALASPDEAVRQAAIPGGPPRDRGAPIGPIEAAVRAELERSDEIVRQAAVHSAGLWRDKEAVNGLIGMLSSPSRQHRRAAAEALGRIGDGRAVPALFKALGDQNDRFLEHSLLYALIEINDPGLIRAEVARTSDPALERAALIALDQMDDGRPEAEQVAKYLISPDPALRDTAAWVAGRHSEWGDALAGAFEKRMASEDLNDTDRANLQDQVAKLAKSPAIEALLARAVQDPKVTASQRQIALGAMAQSGLKDVPQAWLDALTAVLPNDDPALTASIISTIRRLNPKREASAHLIGRLLPLATRDGLPPATRLDALAATPGGIGAPSPQAFDFILSQLNPEQPVPRRLAAADVLAKAKLSDEQLTALTKVIRGAGPLEIDKLLAPFEGSASQDVGVALVDALANAKSLASVRPDSLAARLKKFSPGVRAKAQELTARLNPEGSKQKQKVDEMLGEISAGDVRRGQAIFNSAKAACSSCHAIGYLGGTIGPDLTRIGSVRQERDLLESILFPSASFVQSYEPVIVETADDVFSGVLRRNDADQVVLVTGPGPDQEIRIAREDVKAQRPGQLSIMPAGLDQQLSKQELADLVAFLKACR
jgi:putative membrane-bound dehydrogenase-like protein